MNRHARWAAAYAATTARYEGNRDAAEKRREVLLSSASRVIAMPEINGELAALQALYEQR